MPEIIDDEFYPIDLLENQENETSELQIKGADRDGFYTD